MIMIINILNSTTNFSLIFMVSDIWAVGVTLFYVITHCLPFFSKDKCCLIRKIQNGQFMDGLILNPELRDIIKLCLTVNPLDRPAINQLLDHSYFKVPIQEQSSLLNLKRKFLVKQKEIIVRPENKRRASYDFRSRVLLSGKLGSEFNISNRFIAV